MSLPLLLQIVLACLLGGVLSIAAAALIMFGLPRKWLAFTVSFSTGLLLAMCLPPTIPFYMPAVGSFIAIVIAKHAMGGVGFNIFNPAHIGRAALTISWPVAMTT